MANVEYVEVAAYEDAEHLPVEVAEEVIYVDQSLTPGSRHVSSTSYTTTTRPVHGSPERPVSTTGGSAVEELLQLRFAPADLVPPVRGDTQVSQSVMLELQDLRSRLEVFEDNQKTLEENQRILLEEHTQLKEGLNTAAGDIDNMKRLFDLHKYDLQQLVNSPANKKLTVMHGTTVFSSIIGRFNEMVNTINSLADHVEALGGVGTGSAIASMSSNHVAIVPQRELQASTPPSPAPLPVPVERDSASETGGSASPSLQDSGGPQFQGSLPFAGLEISDGGNVPGVKIASVKAGGPADKMGLKVGDYILNFNGFTVCTRDEFRTALRASPPDEPLAVHFMPEGETSMATGEIVLGRPHRATPTPPPTGVAARPTTTTTVVGGTHSTISNQGSRIPPSPQTSTVVGHPASHSVVRDLGPLHTYTQEEYIAASPASVVRGAARGGYSEYVVMEDPRVVSGGGTILY